MASRRGPPCRCLVLGPEGSGKTLLLKKLKLLCSQPPERRTNSAAGEGKAAETSGAESNSDTLFSGVLPTIPTVGSNVQEIKLGGGVTCMLRECGGQMAPIWSKAYAATHMVIYVIDASNSTQVAPATILLLEVLSAESLRGKPCLLLFNKLDCPSGLSLVELKSVIRVDDIMSSASQTVSVVDGSCVTEVGLREVLDWLLRGAKSCQDAPK